MAAPRDAAKVQRIVARLRREWRLERRGPDRRHTGTDDPCWMVLDRTNSGHGIYGDEAAGQSHYEKHIMFRALEALDPKHDWHEYDWHTLTGPAEDRVRQMLAWRAESEDAAREVAGINALVHLICRSAR